MPPREENSKEILEQGHPTCISLGIWDWGILPALSVGRKFRWNSRMRGVPSPLGSEIWSEGSHLQPPWELNSNGIWEQRYSSLILREIQIRRVAPAPPSTPGADSGP